jgi:hypothetical protein
MTNKHPRLRSHTRRRKNGRVVTYYFYDMRHEGRPDVSLGTDFEEALRAWEEIHHRLPRLVGTLNEAFEKWEDECLPGYANAGTRRTYAQNLKQLKAVFGESTWDAVRLPHLVEYLSKRSAKTQANREMALLSIVWNRARMWGLTELPYPAAGMARSKWKNPEKPRTFEVTDELFAAVYAQADQVLRDCMDLATATGMRLTDCRTILLPRGDVLTLEAKKTGKRADFDLSLSEVLPDLIRRRRALKNADHMMLLSTPTGRPVSEQMLRSRWDGARERAAAQADKEQRPKLAEAIRAMFLRDMRKRAADLAEDMDEAAQLLQHSSTRLTATHYRTRATKLKPVR